MNFLSSASLVGPCCLGAKRLCGICHLEASMVSSIGVTLAGSSRTEVENASSKSARVYFILLCREEDPKTFLYNFSWILRLESCRIGLALLDASSFN